MNPVKKKNKTLTEEVIVREEGDVVVGGLESCRKSSQRLEDLSWALKNG